MAELSKTAKASMIQETKKEVKIETEAEAIRQIRIDRLANLSILREDRIDKLLAAYDRDHAAVLHLANSTAGLLKRAEAAEEAVMEFAWANMLESGKSYRVMRIHDEISVEPIEDTIIEQMIEPTPPADLDFSHIDMATIPDFGHDVTHPHPEGA